MPNLIHFSAIYYNNKTIQTSSMTFVSVNTDITLNSECMFYLCRYSTISFRVAFVVIESGLGDVSF